MELDCTEILFYLQYKMPYEDSWCMGLLPILLVEDCKSDTNLTAQNIKVVGVEKYCQIVRWAGKVALWFDRCLPCVTPGLFLSFR